MTISKERIENVARAIANYKSTMPYCVDDNPYGEFRWQDYTREAKAALKADDAFTSGQPLSQSPESEG